MRNLCRRIEKLQKLVGAKRQARKAIFHGALASLPLPDVELLISAFGADGEGRTLTDNESLAREAYRVAVERECRSVRVRSPLGWERTLDVRQAIVIVLALSFSSEEHDLVERAYWAVQQGRAPSARELGAIQAYTAEFDRLCQRAGFGSVAACEGFWSQTEFSTGGNRS